MSEEALRVLILEDDRDLSSGLTFALQQEGYEVATAESIAEARRLARNRRFDLLLLDVMLGDGSGFDFCSEVRRPGADPGAGATGSGRTGEGTSSDVPVIFLTAKDDEVDVVRGLEIGADDYVAKPFRLRELLSRVKARLRREVGRRRPEEAETHSGGAGLSVDAKRGIVSKGGHPVPLTASEYRLLLAFTEHPGQVLTRDQLADRILGIADAAVDDNTVSVYIRRLREKLEDDPSKPRYIVTVRGLGYRYEDQS